MPSNYNNRRKVFHTFLPKDTMEGVKHLKLEKGEPFLIQDSVMRITVEAENDLSNGEILISLHPAT